MNTSTHILHIMSVKCHCGMSAYVFIGLPRSHNAGRRCFSCRANACNFFMSFAHDPQLQYAGDVTVAAQAVPRPVRAVAAVGKDVISKGLKHLDQKGYSAWSRGDMMAKLMELTQKDEGTLNVWLAGVRTFHPRDVFHNRLLGDGTMPVVVPAARVVAVNAADAYASPARQNRSQVDLHQIDLTDLIILMIRDVQLLASTIECKANGIPEPRRCCRSIVTRRCLVGRL